MTFTVRSWPGEALVGQKRYADAEPLLLSGYEGLKQRARQQPPQPKARRIEALQRLVQLYEATGESEKAAMWRTEIEQAE